jgi:hypothetical protein
MNRLWKQLWVLAFILLVQSGIVDGRMQAADLHEGWAVLAEASTDVYYRDRFYSDVTNFAAITKLPDLAKNGRPRQKPTAEALIEVVGKKTIADLTAAESRGKLKSDEKFAQMKILVGGMAATAEQASKNAAQMLDGKRTSPPAASSNDGVTGLFLGTMKDLASSATRMAEADMAAAYARLKLRTAWEAKVFPAIRNLQTTESKTALVAGELTSDGGDRQVWSVFRNIGDKTLTNVTVIFRSKDKINNKEYDLPAQIYFVRQWPKAVVIRPDGFRMKTISIGEPDAAPPAWLSGTLEVWSDQGHTAPADVKRIGYYKYRDQFLETLVKEGAQYSFSDDKSQTSLEFTKVVNGKGTHTVDAKLTRQAKGKDQKPEELRLKGIWSEYRNRKAGDREDQDEDATTPTLKLLPLAAGAIAPALKKGRPNAKQNPGEAAFAFQLKYPFIQLESPDGTKVTLQPQPEANTAK